MIVLEKCSFLADRFQFLKHKNDIGRTEGERGACVTPLHDAA